MGLTTLEYNNSASINSKSKATFETKAAWLEGLATGILLGTIIALTVMVVTMVFVSPKRTETEIQEQTEVIKEENYKYEIVE